jgi:small subunit ribosomal protein S17
MRKLKGIIKSVAMQKTVVVEVFRLKKHRKYLKPFTITKRIKAHVDDTAQFTVGDEVTIAATRPISREKRWRVIEKIKAVKQEKQDAEKSA